MNYDLRIKNMLRIYNTLSHRVEEFKPLDPSFVGIYSCGPTVYDYSHIGHIRRYVGDDLLIRVLKNDGFKVKHVMNITDVGHLVSDADLGEDKMEKGARKFGLSVWDVAKKFENQFFASCKALNIIPADVYMKATDNIAEQIDLIKTLEQKGFTYEISDGIYFDTSKFPDYFKLSGQKIEDLKAGARVEVVGGKRNISDFALWKFSPKGEKRQMEWESPWGVGFPGWHIECSAMSMKALGPSFDIHTGGIDHINIHHTNEIAQSEAATGKTFVKYWVHHAFLRVEGEKMSKSLENIYTVQDVIKKGYDPLSLRYLYLQTHYRQEMNFTWEALEASQTALNRLRRELSSFEYSNSSGIREYQDQFTRAINDDLNMPKALSVLWEVMGSDNSNTQKVDTAYKFDEILGLSLNKSKDILQKNEKETPEKIKKMLAEREKLRKEKKYEEADKMREEIIKMGYKVEDKS